MKLSEMQRQIEQFVKWSGKADPYVHFNVYSSKGSKVGNFTLRDFDYTPTNAMPVIEMKFQVTETY